MSKVIFTTRSGRAAVGSGERYRFSQILTAITTAEIEGLFSRRDGCAKPIKGSFADSLGLNSVPILNALPAKDHDYFFWRNNRFSKDDFRLWLSASCSRRLVMKGKAATILEVAMNTAQSLRSDALTFMARLHGQCEVHAYVNAGDRRWLADLIERLKYQSVLHEGWRHISALLREDGDGSECVLSYSVISPFPNAEAAGLDEETSGWQGLSDDERWQAAMNGLRHQPKLRWDPVTWTSVRFGPGWDAFQLVEWLK